MTPDSLRCAATNRPDTPTVTLNPKARAAAHQVYRTTRSLDAALGAYSAIADALPTVTFTRREIALIKERASWEYEEWDEEAHAGAYTELGLELCAIVEKMKHAPELAPSDD